MLNLMRIESQKRYIKKSPLLKILYHYYVSLVVLNVPTNCVAHALVCFRLTRIHNTEQSVSNKEKYKIVH